jgi:hypothetical protein
MDTEKILLALEERERWMEREEDMRREIKETPKHQRQEKQEELVRIKEQVAYYDALAKDMKKSTKPPKVSHLMNSLL